MDQDPGLHRSAETLAPESGGLAERIRRDAPLALLDLVVALAAYLVTLVLRFDGSVSVVTEGDRSTYKDFTVLVDAERFGMDAAALAGGLAAEGVQTRRYYSPPVHRQRAYRTVGPSNGALPVTDDAAARVLTLPLWTGMDDDQVDRVGVAVARLARG